MAKNATSESKDPMNDREKKVWSNAIDNMIDQFGEEAFAMALYERTKDRRHEAEFDYDLAQEFFAMMDERVAKMERG